MASTYNPVIRTRKIAAGDYAVSDGWRTVEVTYEGRGQWLALAGWNRLWFSNPLRTRREAVIYARAMLREQERLTPTPRVA